MRPESLRSLFEHAMALLPEQRSHFVHGLIESEATKALLMRMLEQSPTPMDAPQEVQPNTERIQRSAVNLFTRPLNEIAEQLIPEILQTDWLGRQIGDFTLLSTLGSGGSAWVFKATREVAGVMQPVALKLFRRVLIDAPELHRFRRERQALTQLEHPNIARYIDGGVTPEGLAYIAMELVNGEFLTMQAQMQQWSLRQRLEAFAKVCSAVESAHQALIVHRDIKPSNVLVTEAGEVKLLDFGIAKFLSPTGQEVTETHNLLLTPGYAAPEQFNGGHITTQTDVYALGLLLSELLTNRKQARTVVSPSSLVRDKRKLAQQLSGDLDTIVLKASAEDPRDRYSHAAALAHDIQRHLDNEPILARRPRLPYVLGKFVRRHALACALVATTVVGISISVVIAWQQAHIARAQAQLAQSTQQFLIDVFRSAEPSSPGRDRASVAEVTERAIVELGSTNRLVPEARASLLIQLAAVLRGQGDIDRATQVLSELINELPSNQQALQAQAMIELVATHFAANRESEVAPFLDRLEEITATLATSQQVEVILLRSKWHDMMGHDVGVQYALASQAVDLCSTLEVADRSSARGGSIDVRFLHYAASHVRALSGFAIPVCDAALQIRVLLNHARMATPNGEFDVAIESYEKALGAARASFGERHILTGDILNSYAGTLRYMRRPSDAEPLAEAAVAIYRELLPEHHWRRIDALSTLGSVQSELNKFREAHDNQLQALTLSRSMSSAPSDGDYVLLSNLGFTAAALGRFAEARDYQAQALELSLADDQRSPSITAITRCRLGLAEAMTGDLARGLALCDEAIADLVNGDQMSQERVIEFMRDRGLILQWQHRYTESLHAIEDSLNRFDRVSRRKSPPERFRLVAGLINAKWLAGELENPEESLLRTIAQAGEFNIRPGLRIDLYLSLAEAIQRRLGKAAARNDPAWVDAMEHVDQLGQQVALLPFQEDRKVALNKPPQV